MQKITTEFEEYELRRLAEAHLRAVNYSTSRIHGMAFFRKLVQDLSESLRVKYVVLGELVKHDSEDAIQTLAAWNGVTWPANFNYSLENTPCQDVVSQKPCFISCDIQQEYPLDYMLVEMRAESYIGTPLIGVEGETLGVLVALDVEPMDEKKRYLALSLLTVFATRCAAELQHRKREAKLESRVLARTMALNDANERLLKNEEKLKHAAYHDELTGLANRALFYEHMERALQQSQRNRSAITLMLIDLDGFKAINDQHGHGTGDMVLITVAQRLKEQLRASDLVARLGGDEFVVLLQDVEEPNFRNIVAQSLINSVLEPISAGELTVGVGCSIGIASASSKMIDGQALLDQADNAMYQAKKAGKGTWRLAEDATNSSQETTYTNDRKGTYGSEGLLLQNKNLTSPPVLAEDEKRKLTTANLLSLNSSTSRMLGDDFFKILVKDLAEAIGVHYIIAGELKSQQDSETIETLAIWAGGDWLPNITYDLENTPCHDVTCQTMCFHSSGIQKSYPLDQMLVDMQVESYIGMPMIDTRGETVGTLVAMDTAEINEDKRYMALSLLTMFATRGAAELQHSNRQTQLEVALAKKTQELQAAQDQLKKLSTDNPIP